MPVICHRLQTAHYTKVAQSGCSKPLILKLACCCILKAGPVTSLTGKQAEKTGSNVVADKNKHLESSLF
jgi:hypothetical protein